MKTSAAWLTALLILLALMAMMAMVGVVSEALGGINESGLLREGS